MSRLGCSLYLDPAKRLREKREAVLLTQMYLVPFPQFIRYITPPPLERYTCGHRRGLIGKKKKKKRKNKEEAQRVIQLKSFLAEI